MAPEFSPKQNSRSCPVARFLGAEVKEDEMSYSKKGDGAVGAQQWPEGRKGRCGHAGVHSL